MRRLCREYDIPISPELDLEQLATHFSITYQEINSVLQRFKTHCEDKNAREDKNAQLGSDTFKSILVEFLGERELIGRKAQKAPTWEDPNCPYDIPGGCGSIYIDDPGASR